MQFARVAQATDFIYCYTILESNKRLEYTSTPNATNSNSTSSASNQPASTSSTTAYVLNKPDSGGVTAELSTFFPFDPYRLPRSSVFIRDVYREWSSVAIDGESDDEESDEEPDEDYEETNYGHSGARSSSPEGDRCLAIPPGKAHAPSPRRKGRNKGEGENGEDDTTCGLGESLEQMSISPRYGGGATGTSVMSVTMSFVG